jgi:protein-L-isoaspartate(D-aspartate) O-methyltransferase
MDWKMCSPHNDFRDLPAHFMVWRIVPWLAVALCVCQAAAGQADERRFVLARAALVKAIEADVRATSNRIGTDHLDPAVLEAMREVKRHRFVPPAFIDRAYDNNPLPIGYGQTISQPYIVALMTNMLAIAPGDRVLEIGTGSGYQAAVLAHMGIHVFSIEIIRPLAERAERRLRTEGYDTVRVKLGDGYFGWPAQAPFDAIVVTAAADHVPPPLLSQLKAGGRMVIPVGGRFSVQQLVLVTKDADGRVSARQLLPVRFVPLTRRP